MKASRKKNKQQRPEISKELKLFNFQIEINDVQKRVCENDEN